jgi:four helix bundle protein
MNKKGLESLQVWQRARTLAVLVCRELLLQFPIEEKFALSQQLRRAVQSVPANIAEAHGRFHYQDAIRFCYIARGSLDETLSHLLLAHDLGYISDDSLDACREIWREVYRLLNGYIVYLKRIRQEDVSLKIRDEGWSTEYDLVEPDP